VPAVWVPAGLAQRLVAEGEPVLDVPARLSARVRALGGGSGRKTDDADAFAVAVAGLRAHDLQPVRADVVTEIRRLLSTRRQEVVAQRISQFRDEDPAGACAGRAVVRPDPHAPAQQPCRRPLVTATPVDVKPHEAGAASVRG
jgi:hypothetical protein